MPISLAHALTRALSDKRKSGALPWLRPDGKAQVTVVYKGDRPVAVDTVVVSTQHSPDIAPDALRDAIIAEIIEPTIDPGLRTEPITYHINPTGRFVVGGPQGDAGLTGRKIIVDTYGGMGRHGGGAFSGKDPSKVDRSASYAARWVAKNIVAAGLARRVEVQLAYAIGVAEPVSVMVESFGSGVVPDDELERAVRSVFDLTPAAIISHLELRHPIYLDTASYGHFGRTPEQAVRHHQSVALFNWERTDRVDALRDAVPRS